MLQSHSLNGINPMLLPVLCHAVTFSFILSWSSCFCSFLKLVVSLSMNPTTCDPPAPNLRFSRLQFKILASSQGISAHSCSFLRGRGRKASFQGTLRRAQPPEYLMEFCIFFYNPAKFLREEHALCSQEKPGILGSLSRFRKAWENTPR